MSMKRLRPAVPADMPDDYRALMETCWAFDPVARPTFCMVLACLRKMFARHCRSHNGAGSRPPSMHLADFARMPSADLSDGALSGSAHTARTVAHAAGEPAPLVELAPVLLPALAGAIRAGAHGAHSGARGRSPGAAGGVGPSAAVRPGRAGAPADRWDRLMVRETRAAAGSAAIWACGRPTQLSPVRSLTGSAQATDGSLRPPARALAKPAMDERPARPVTGMGVGRRSISATSGDPTRKGATTLVWHMGLLMCKQAVDSGTPCGSRCTRAGAPSRADAHVWGQHVCAHRLRMAGCCHLLPALCWDCCNPFQYTPRHGARSLAGRLWPAADVRPLKASPCRILISQACLLGGHSPASLHVHGRSFGSKQGTCLGDIYLPACMCMGDLMGHRKRLCLDKIHLPACMCIKDPLGQCFATCNGDVLGCQLFSAR